MADTDKETTLTEEEKQDDEKFKEINAKPEEERTDEEKKEIIAIKERYGKRMQKKIDKMTWETRTAQEEREEAIRKQKELEDEIKALKAEKKPEPSITKTTIDIGGRAYYTDEALIAMVKAGEISENEAYKKQRERDKAELKADLRKELDDEQRRKSEEDIRVEDGLSVLKEYPHFSKKHPNFNPDDPLYKLSTQIYKNGYYANPKGLSESIKLAKQILARDMTAVDRSGDFSAEESGVPESTGRRKQKDVALDEDEKEVAVRMYCRGDVKNPKTGRPYTKAEALTKALEAKKARLEK